MECAPRGGMDAWIRPRLPSCRRPRARIRLCPGAGPGRFHLARYPVGPRAVGRLRRARIPRRPHDPRQPARLLRSNLAGRPGRHAVGRHEVGGPHALRPTHGLVRCPAGPGRHRGTGHRGAGARRLRPVDRFQPRTGPVRSCRSPPDGRKHAAGRGHDPVRRGRARRHRLAGQQSRAVGPSSRAAGVRPGPARTAVRRGVHQRLSPARGSHRQDMDRNAPARHVHHRARRVRGHPASRPPRRRPCRRHGVCTGRRGRR